MTMEEVYKNKTHPEIY